MVEITVNGAHQHITFSACHIIQGHRKCSRLHGHNYAVSITLKGEIEDGLLMDFGDMKREARKICKMLDHRMLVPRHMAEMSGDDCIVESLGKRYVVPKEDVLVMDLKYTTTEELSKWFLAQIRDSVEFPDKVKTVRILVEEMGGQGAWSEVEL